MGNKKQLIEDFEHILHELKVIQKLWFDKNKTYLSSIDNTISFVENRLKELK